MSYSYKSKPVVNQTIVVTDSAGKKTNSVVRHVHGSEIVVVSGSLNGGQPVRAHPAGKKADKAAAKAAPAPVGASSALPPADPGK